MKIEFVKEEKIDGGVTYYTTVDGCYVSNSIELQEEKARKIYDFIVRTKSTTPVKTVLDAYEG